MQTALELYKKDLHVDDLALAHSWPVGCLSAGDLCDIKYHSLVYILIFNSRYLSQLHEIVLDDQPHWLEPVIRLHVLEK